MYYYSHRTYFLIPSIFLEIVVCSDFSELYYRCNRMYVYN
jgi:hypothetical protein